MARPPGQRVCVARNKWQKGKCVRTVGKMCVNPHNKVVAGTGTGVGGAAIGELCGRVCGQAEGGGQQLNVCLSTQRRHQQR